MFEQLIYPSFTKEMLSTTKLTMLPQMVLPKNIHFPIQKHTSIVHNLNKSIEKTIADAVYTSIPNMYLGIKTADCLPILLQAKYTREICAIHAGWRSLATNIIPNALSFFHEKPENILVWFGPHICAKNFLVHHDVIDVFTANDWNYDLLQLASNNQISTNRNFGLSLSCLARAQLENLGVLNIEDSNICTYQNSKTMYSHRRNRDTGRLLHIVSN